MSHIIGRPNWGNFFGKIFGKIMGLIAWAGLARFAEISARLDLLNATKINFAITWQPGQPG